MVVFSQMTPFLIPGHIYTYTYTCVIQRIQGQLSCKIGCYNAPIIYHQLVFQADQLVFHDHQLVFQADGVYFVIAQAQGDYEFQNQHQQVMLFCIKY